MVHHYIFEKVSGSTFGLLRYDLLSQNDRAIELAMASKLKVAGRLLMEAAKKSQ